MTIITLSDFLKSRYGTKVYKLSLQSGCSCPNRDGTIGYGGCSFCSEGGSGDFAAPLLPIAVQIAIAKEKVDGKFPAGIRPEDRKYIAYFQSFTNTYGDPRILGKLYRETIAYPGIVALSIGTRPDCISEEMLGILKSIKEQSGKDIWIELGLQTMHDKTAEAFGRGYSLEVFEDAYRKIRTAGLTCIVHVILGLPGESREDMLSTVRYLAGLKPGLEGIKLQLLHVLKGTKMGEDYQKEPFHVMSLDEYADLIIDCLRILPENTVVHRMTGDAPKRLLIEPKWSADKKRVLNELNRRITLSER